MSENTVLVVIAVVVGCGVLAVMAYYIARFMRGSIKLSLTRTVFNPGETMTGSFDLHTKKAIQGNKLIVRLIGTQVSKTYKDGKKRMHSQEIYRDEVLVEDAKAYAAGYKAKYNFEIPAPNMQSPEFLNSTVGQALTAAVSLLSNRSTRLNWKVEARLDAKGIDLATAQSVSINTIN
ncbi:hypothetical protein [Desulfobulbus alkaliphilus]|uniref:hypothetical protein n=1 Tax=Desulfobulbus alkaliphilus TaxID=869814 RepID=UPI0019654C2B|nr:hypothetical protein [Desulfobulbus alkaliphilus]MBM9535666.1 hypothetical protein [Desulfobulbus alkaliphilus]